MRHYHHMYWKCWQELRRKHDLCCESMIRALLVLVLMLRFGMAGCRRHSRALRLLLHALSSSMR